MDDLLPWPVQTDGHAVDVKQAAPATASDAAGAFVISLVRLLGPLGLGIGGKERAQIRQESNISPLTSALASCSPYRWRWMRWIR